MKVLFPLLLNGEKHKGYHINKQTKPKQKQLNQRKTNHISYQAINNVKLDQKQNLKQSVIKQNMHNSGKPAIDIFCSTECTKAQV